MNINNYYKGALYMILSSLFFTTMNLFSKCACKITMFQKSFTANLISSFIVSILIIKSKKSFWGSKGNKKYLMLRGICGSTSQLFLYYSIDHLYLSQSTLLSKLSPIFASLFGILFFKDSFSKKQLLFYFLTLIGMLLVIKPDINMNILAFICGLIASLLAACAFTMIRLAGKSESSYTIIFYNLIFALLLNAPLSLIHIGNFAFINRYSFIFMIFAGIFIVFGQIFLTLAYKNSKPVNIAIYDYTGIIISGIYGFLLFHEKPDIYALCGYIIIFASAALNTYFLKKEQRS